MYAPSSRERRQGCDAARLHTSNVRTPAERWLPPEKVLVAFGKSVCYLRKKRWLPSEKALVTSGKSRRVS